MKEFQFVLKNDYDEKLKINNKTFFSYSPKKFNKLYKSKGEYELLGAAKSDGRNEIGTLIMSSGYWLKVFNEDDINKVIFRKVGYAAVGEDQYIIIYKSRIPFLILFILLIAAVILAVFGIGKLLSTDKPGGQRKGPDQEIVSIKPDFPLPEKDPNLEEVPTNVNGQGNKKENPDVVGSASMSYTLSADVSLSTSNVEMLFENPSDSNQAVTIELLILSDGNKYSIAKSGLLPVGTKLQKMNLNLDSISISEGIYTGLYRISFYNPLTGEKAIVESELTDVKITVKN